MVELQQGVDPRVRINNELPLLLEAWEGHRQEIGKISIRVWRMCDEWVEATVAMGGAPARNAAMERLASMHHLSLARVQTWSGLGQFCREHDIEPGMDHILTREIWWSYRHFEKHQARDVLHRLKTGGSAAEARKIIATSRSVAASMTKSRIKTIKRRTPKPGKQQVKMEMHVTKQLAEEDTGQRVQVLVRVENEETGEWDLYAKVQ